MKTAPPALPTCITCQTALDPNGTCPRCRAPEDWNDQVEALDFVLRRLREWHSLSKLTDRQIQTCNENHEKRRQAMVAAGAAHQTFRCDDTFSRRDECWSCKEYLYTNSSHCPSCGVPVTDSRVRSLRSWIYLAGELESMENSGLLSSRQAHELLAETQEHINGLHHKLKRDRAKMVIPVTVAPPAAVPVTPAVTEAESAGPKEPRRPILEILLDPHSIQWLLAIGGAMGVLGLIIYLVALGIFENKVVIAVAMGLGTAAGLFGGWAAILRTRYQLAGRALTLLACLVMPLNLWFYDSQGLISVDRHLWIAALVCCVLYAASAWVLKDQLFVYVLVGGVAMTGLLMLADNGKFWEVAPPVTLLVILGLACVGIERAFPPVEEGPFTRKRFGMAFFWSGQGLLAGGLLFLAGAQLFGWMHPLFEMTVQLPELLARRPAIVEDQNLRMWAAALVLAGMAAYLYSDIVVRRVGFYVYMAILNLLWAEILIVNLFEWDIALELVIGVLALTALAANLLQLFLTQKVETLSRSGPPLGLFLSSIPVALGLILHMRATNLFCHEHWPYAPGWGYVAAMLATAISCRVGAFLFRHTMPWLSITYFIGTAAATLVGAMGLMVVLGVSDWTYQVLLLIVIPIAYLIAAWLYKGHTAEKPLIFVGHVATAIMAVTVLATILDIVTPFFAPPAALPEVKNPVHLRVALFFAEAAIFYVLATILRPKGYNVYLGATMACAAVWQLLTYLDTPAEYYTLAFSVLGFALLVAYRLNVLERFSQSGLDSAGFQCANVLLTLAFAATALLTLRDIAFHAGETALLRTLVFLLVLQTLLGLLSAWLVQHQAWRRWYVIAAIAMGALTFLVLYKLSELNNWQKLEIFSIALGLVLLVLGHIGWRRELEREQDMVSLGLSLGSLLLVAPLIIAVGLYRTSTVTYIDAPTIVSTTRKAIDTKQAKLKIPVNEPAKDQEEKQKDKELTIPKDVQVFIKGNKSDLQDLDRYSDDTIVWVGLAENNEVKVISVIRRFHFPDELGLFVAGLVLLSSGIVLRIKSTTVTGGLALGLDLAGMLLFIRIPEARQTLGLFLAIGGLSLFAVALLLSVFRDRLLTLPDRIKRREGIYRVLDWR